MIFRRLSNIFYMHYFIATKICTTHNNCFLIYYLTLLIYDWQKNKLSNIIVIKHISVNVINIKTNSYVDDRSQHWSLENKQKLLKLNDSMWRLSIVKYLLKWNKKKWCYKHSKMQLKEEWCRCIKYQSYPFEGFLRDRKVVYSRTVFLYEPVYY